MNSIAVRNRGEVHFGKVDNVCCVASGFCAAQVCVGKGMAETLIVWIGVAVNDDNTL